MDWLTNLLYWHWWVLGILLLTLEMFAPGAVFIWFAAGAFIVGTLLLIIPAMTWEIQFLLFAVLSIASVVVWRVYKTRNPEDTGYPALNRRGEQLVGRIVTLEQPIQDQVGKIRIDDTTWKVTGPDLPIGSKVRVESAEGTVLIVDAA